MSGVINSTSKYLEVDISIMQPSEFFLDYYGGKAVLNTQANAGPAVNFWGFIGGTRDAEVSHYVGLAPSIGGVVTGADIAARYGTQEGFQDLPSRAYMPAQNWFYDNGVQRYFLEPAILFEPRFSENAFGLDTGPGTYYWWGESKGSTEVIYTKAFYLLKETEIHPQDLDRAREDALKALQQAQARSVDATRDLDTVRSELEAYQQRLEALNSEQALSLTAKVLEGISLTGTYAQNLLPSKLPTGLLTSTFSTLKNTSSTSELVDSSSELFKDPSLSNVQKFSESLANWLVDATGYEGALGKWLGAIQAVKQTGEFYDSINEYLDDKARVNENIERTQQRIIELKQQEAELNNSLHQINNQILDRGSEAVQIHEAGAFVEFIAPQSKAVLAFSQGNTFQVDGNEDGRDVAVSLMDNAQKVTFKSGSGVVDGHNSANDTVVLIGNRSDFIETNAGTAGAVFERGGAKVIVTDVDRVQFSDGTLAFDIDSGDKAGLAFRTYQAAFDRAPDANGLAFHIKNLDAGQSFNDMATGFINSPEFKALYGENTSDATFVNALYHNVLGREPDSEGRQYYLNRLAQDPGERDSILIGFAESPENIALTGFSTQSGVWFPGA